MVGVLSRKLLREMWQQKGSLLALVLIASVGVACFTGMLTVYLDLAGARDRFYRGCRLADFSVAVKRAPLSAVRGLEALPGVRAVQARVRLPVRVSLPAETRPLSGTAISLPPTRAPVIDDVQLVRGTWFSPGGREEALVDDAFARARGLGPGSRLRVVLLDQEHDLLVVGTVMSPEFVYVLPPGSLAPDPARAPIVYLPRRFLQEAGDLDGACNEVVGLAAASAPAALRASLRRVEERLDPYGVVAGVPVFEEASTMLLASELRGLEVDATLLPLICLGTVVLVLHVVMRRRVAAQRTVIGTLRALGYGAGDLAAHYLAQGVIVGLAGGALGIGLGLWIQDAMLALYRYYFEIPGIQMQAHPAVLAAGLAVALGAGALGAMSGVRMAAALAPAEAMRPAPPERGGRIFLERIPALWRRLPFRWKMIARSVFRNPFRSSVAFVAVMLSTALLLEALFMLDGVHFMIDHEFRQAAHQDLTVALRDPVSRRAVDELRGLPGVTAVEPQLDVPCDLERGPYRRRVGVVALPPGGRLCTPLDGRGRPVPIPDRGLVLTRRLAEILHARPGDHVHVRALLARRREADVAVAGVVDTYVGLAAYADLDFMSRLLGEEPVANALLARVSGGQPGAALLRGLVERPIVVGVDERARALRRMTAILEGSLGASMLVLVGFTGLLAFGSTLNTALVTLNEREREVGTLRVLGYTAWEVERIFAGESFLVGLMALLCGLAAGVGLAHLIAYAYDSDLLRLAVVLSPRTFVKAALLVAAFLGLAQAAVYRSVRTLPWLDAFKVRE